MATYKTKADVVITPATWKQRANTLERTPTNLLNLVGWYGSTHTSAMWRKAHKFLDVFQGIGVIGFDPQIDDWDISYMAIEAEIMATASVIIIRLENNELINGSLGSIAEIGMALTSAALRGQVVIISIEDDLLTSLNEPGAIAQYMMIEMALEKLQEIPTLAQYMRLHRSNDLQELAILACETAKQQIETPKKGLNFKEFLIKRTKRKKNRPLHVLLGGSGGPYAEVHKDSFLKKKQLLTSACRARGQTVRVLSEGAIAESWSIPYGSINNTGVALTTRTLLSIEAEFKQEADILLLPIMSEAASKAAATEIGLLLLYALTTGQDIKIFLEPFNPVDYIYHQLKKVDVEGCTNEKLIRTALHQAGVSDSILALAVQEEVLETLEVFKTLMQGDTLTFKQVKQSLLGKTEAFHNADNTRRVRALVQAHLERLRADERFPRFFWYSNQIYA